MTNALSRDWWPGRRTHHTGTTRNIVMGEMYDSRHYTLPSGRQVTVKTICEMGGAFIGRVLTRYWVGVDWGFEPSYAVFSPIDLSQFHRHNVLPRALYPGRLPRMVMWSARVKLFFLRLWLRHKL
jgi:hypothetical protein